MTDEPSFHQFADLDRVVHEPARLAIMAVLYSVESADFLYLLHSTGLTKGNLSSHLMRLEEAGYVLISKSFRGKLPQTTCALTAAGRDAFQTYRRLLRQAVDSLPTQDEER
jgi:DNA-binding MarR family transcriptional regulator